MFQQSRHGQHHRIVLIDPLPAWVLRRFSEDDLPATLQIVGHKHEYAPLGESIASPNLVLLGMDEPSQDHIGLLQDIRRRWPAIGITILVPSLKPHDFLLLFALGVQGYLPWESQFEDIMAALSVVATGGWVGGSRIIPQLLGLGAARHSHDVLTPTELAVIVCIAEDQSNDEISQVLGMSTKTVERHISNLLRKTSARSRVGLTRWWLNYTMKHH
ncbi:MAG TPA: response regulator transcription factor [Herpetosiphonaceae bacterium]|nr:response regulator transcription factor [Herpetosiphonaceae bacterium]